MPTARTAPDSARRSERARRAILTAALELAGEEGASKLCIEGIAARARVGKQTIYRWWPSKEAVLFDAFLGRGDSHDGHPPSLPDTGDLEADLKQALRATLAELDDPSYDEPMRALTAAIAHDAELAAAYAERLEGPLRQARRERLRSAQDAGELAHDVDLDVAVELIWGPLTSRWIQRSGPLTPQYADELVRTALRGLRPRRG